MIRRVQFDIAEGATVLTGEKTRVDIAPGRLEGVLELTPYVDPLYCSLDMGYFRVSLRFKAVDGRDMEYRTILPYMTFWPNPDAECEVSAEMAEECLALEKVIDIRDPFEIRLNDGRSMTGFFKYVDSRSQVRIEGDNLDVRLTFYWTETEGYCTVAHQLPLSCLMWKKAPAYDEGEFDSQGAEYVDIRRWEGDSLDTAPSPVSVE